MIHKLRKLIKNKINGVWYGTGLRLKDSTNICVRHIIHFNELKELYRVPLYFDSYVMRNHLKMWIFDNNITMKYFEQNINCANEFDFYNCKTVEFYEKKEADKFMAWWNNYTIKFDENSYKEMIFPTFTTPGKVEGWFVKSREENKKYDITKYSDLVQILFSKDNDYSSEFEWMYIIHHTKEKAYCCDNGWIFINQQDAVNFKLFL